VLPKHVSWGYCIDKNDSGRITPKRSAKTGRHSIDTGGTSPKSGAVTGQLGYWIDTPLGVFTYCTDTQFGLLD